MVSPLFTVYVPSKVLPPPVCEDCGTFRYLNPGSVSIPKNGSRHSYMTLENGQFTWKDVTTGEPWQNWSL